MDQKAFTYVIINLLLCAISILSLCCSYLYFVRAIGFILVLFLFFV